MRGGKVNEFIAKIKSMTTEYGVTVSELSITLAIEIFADLRNYPSSWSEDKRLADMEKNKSKIAMGAIEIDSKEGAENQITHNANGTNRSFYAGIMAYKDVIGFVNIM